MNKQKISDTVRHLVGMLVAGITLASKRLVGGAD